MPVSKVPGTCGWNPGKRNHTTTMVTRWKRVGETDWQKTYLCSGCVAHYSTQGYPGPNYVWEMVPIIPIDIAALLKEE